MAKAIKTVKEKKELQSLLSTITTGKDLLRSWIDLDPIYVGEKTSANYELSIHKHLVESTDRVTIDGHWCEFGVKEGRSLHWLIDRYPSQVIHGFDSWQGLPEDWNHGTGKVADMSCDPPDVPVHGQEHQVDHNSCLLLCLCRGSNLLEVLATNQTRVSLAMDNDLLTNAGFCLL